MVSDIKVVNSDTKSVKVRHKPCQGGQLNRCDFAPGVLKGNEVGRRREFIRKAALGVKTPSTRIPAL